jgi:hypothetical protein
MSLSLRLQLLRLLQCLAKTLNFCGTQGDTVGKYVPSLENMCSETYATRSNMFFELCVFFVFRLRV